MQFGVVLSDSAMDSEVVVLDDLHGPNHAQLQH